MARKSDLQRVRDAIYKVMGEGIAFSILPSSMLTMAMDAVSQGLVKRVTDLETVREYVKKRIEENTFTGKDDPGQWSPTARVIVHCKSGIDSGAYETYFQDQWYKIDEELGNLYHEPYNAAIITFWEN